ncbi:MAG: MGMT family protein [Phycisphaeraceae bacterium]|nr:MGMT family protein [Phycisphaeraceae bacterium]
MGANKSWRQKLGEAKAKDDLPKVIEKDGCRFVVPSPAEVEREMRKVRRGQVRTVAEIAERIAREHGVETCCPMTTGIFAWIIAHAHDEGANDGAQRTAAWWRTVKARGELNPRYPGGVAKQSRLLRAEGRTIRTAGARAFVRGVES